MTNVYFDASALLPLFIDDGFTPAAKAIAAAHVVSISDWTTAECTSAIGRAVRIGLLTRDQAHSTCGSIDVWALSNARRVEMEAGDARFADTLLRRFEFNLRAPDALHIALARRLGLRLATFDRNMALCASALGLTVVNGQV